MFEDLLEKTSFTHGEKLILYVIRTLNEIVEMGLLSKGPFVFTDPEKVNEVLEDFRPEDKEIEETIVWMKMEGYIE